MRHIANALWRYVHPAVVQAAEAGCMACYTEIPTDDVALQAFSSGLKLVQNQHTLGYQALYEVVASEPQHTKDWESPQYGNLSSLVQQLRAHV